MQTKEGLCPFLVCFVVKNSQSNLLTNNQNVQNSQNEMIFLKNRQKNITI